MAEDIAWFLVIEGMAQDETVGGVVGLTVGRMETPALPRVGDRVAVSVIHNEAGGEVVDDAILVEVVRVIHYASWPHRPPSMGDTSLPIDVLARPATTDDRELLERLRPAIAAQEAQMEALRRTLTGGDDRPDDRM